MPLFAKLHVNAGAAGPPGKCAHQSKYVEMCTLPICVQQQGPLMESLPPLPQQMVPLLRL